MRRVTLRPKDGLLAYKPLFWALLALLPTLALVGCQPGEETAEPAAVELERVENTTLGVAIANLPPVFQVAVNEGDRLELVPSDAELGGRLSVVAGEVPEVGGVNLVAAVRDHQADIESRPDGNYQGQRELQGLPLGTSFYSRGRYTTDAGTTEEETVVYFLHPSGDRPLMLIYRYPAGDDSPVRLQDQLFEVALELEALMVEPVEGAATSEEVTPEDGAEPAADAATGGG